MTNTVDIAGEFAVLERATRSLLTETVQAATPAPDFKARTDAVMAYQAIGAALRAAELTGPLNPSKMGQALRVVQAVRAAYTFLGDSNGVAATLAEAENYCLRYATASRENEIVRR